MAMTENDVLTNMMASHDEQFPDSSPFARGLVEHEYGKALDAIPDGWAKVDGKWVDLNSKQGTALLRCWYAEYPELRP